MAAHARRSGRVAKRQSRARLTLTVRSLSVMAHYAFGGEGLMKLMRRSIALLIVLVAGSSACTIGRPTPHASPTAHPSSVTSAADAQRCARLASRGFTPCPPRADQLTLPATTIRNATNGAVPDATAQQWGRAFQLAQAYY